MEKVRVIITVLSVIILSIGLSAWNSSYGQQTGEWKAPASAGKLKNPLSANSVATQKGKKLYKQMCAITAKSSAQILCG